MLFFQLNVFLEVYLMDLAISLSGNVYDFSVDYDSIDKSPDL